MKLLSIRNIIPSLFLFLAVIPLACNDEILNNRSANAAQEAELISTYLNSLSPQTDEEGKLINDLRQISYSNISRHTLSSNEDIVIADVSEIHLNGELIVKTLFFIQDGKIVRSNIVTFSNGHADHEDIILSIATAQFDRRKYNGKIGYYSIYGTPQFFNVLEDAQIKINGTLYAKKGARSNGRAQGCIDWYLITTYHYTNGTSSTSEQYLYTTCDDDCQTTRSTSMNCGGGGGPGAGYSTYPPGPGSDGDTWSITEPNGKTTHYTFVGASNTWTITLIILPSVVVQSEPYNYPHLVTDGPANDGQLVNGPDGFLYEYDAAGGAWEAGPAATVGGPNPASVVTNRAQHMQCFNRSQGATLTIFVDQPVPNSTASSIGTNVGHAWISITQNGVTRTFGYYPNGTCTPFAPSEPGVLVNDSGHAFDVSVTVPISSTELSQVLNYTINNLPDTYNLNDFNCTNFVTTACAQAGITLPQNEGNWPGGGGQNPGRFGQDMRTFDIPNKTETRDLDGGNAPADGGTCN